MQKHVGICQIFACKSNNPVNFLQAILNTCGHISTTGALGGMRLVSSEDVMRAAHVPEFQHLWAQIPANTSVQAASAGAGLGFLLWDPARKPAKTRR